MSHGIQCSDLCEYSKILGSYVSAVREYIVSVDSSVLLNEMSI